MPNVIKMKKRSKAQGTKWVLLTSYSNYYHGHEIVEIDYIAG